MAAACEMCICQEAWWLCRWDPFIGPVPGWLCLFPSRALEHFSIAQVNCQEFQPAISTLHSAAGSRVTDSWISGSQNIISFHLQPWQTEMRCQQWMSGIKELIFGLTTLISVWKGTLARRLHSRFQPESVNRERQLQSFEKPLIKTRIRVRCYCVSSKGWEMRTVVCNFFPG